jgi:CRISPR-associated protein Cas1
MKELTASSIYWVRRFKSSGVLVLSGVNPVISVDGDLLVLKQGETLGDKTPESVKYGRGVHGLFWVICDGVGGSISVAAIRWLASQNIGLFIGGASNLIVCSHFAKPIITLRRKQYNADDLELAKWFLILKLQACMRVIPALNEINDFYDVTDRGRLNFCKSVDDVRLVEARAALIYWGHYKFELKHYAKWPDWWTEFNTRSSTLSAGNRHANHPVNAILNYGYGVVAGMVKKHCLLVGLDTAIGYLHADNNARHSLVYDVIELIRADVDYLLISWIKSVKWRRTDFNVSERGVVSLDHNLRRIVAGKLQVIDKLAAVAVKKFVLILLKS